jgi:transposase
MRFAGIDVASQTHVVAVVDESGEVLVKPTSFHEDAPGYETLFALLGSANDIFVAMEATGHYGRNLFGALTEKHFQVALINPVRTHRFALEDLRRASTDSIDALGIARFAAQKRPLPTPPVDDATDQLREQTRMLDRLTQDIGDRVRQIHRLVDLTFPEFTQHIRTLDSQRATAVLAAYPTAQAYSPSCLRKLARLRYDGKRAIGLAFARTLINAAKTSVGRHHGPVYQKQMQHLCQDVDRLRAVLRDLHAEIGQQLEQHSLGRLLTTIDGLGTLGAARIIAAVGDPARFRNGAAFAAYVGVVPGTKESGLRRGGRASLCPMGNARLRRALYMTTLGAVRRNSWLRTFYERLRANGKLPKVALIASMRKLLMAVYSVAKHRQPFVPRHSTGDSSSST